MRAPAFAGSPAQLAPRARSAGGPAFAGSPAQLALRARSAGHVIVVGGGLAGIAAGLAALDGGARVTLLEARSRLGGETFSVERDGLLVDNGQHVFLRCCHAYRGLLDRLGVADRVVLQERLTLPVLAPGPRRADLRRGRLPAPLHLADAILRYRHLSARERTLVGPAALALDRIDPRDPSVDARCFGEWLRAHRQSPRAVEALWDLIAVPTLNLPAERASLALAAFVFQTGLLRDATAGDIGWAACPLGELHGAAAASALARGGADVRLRARVSAIEDGPAVVVNGERLTADSVILAVPHDVAGRLVPPAAAPPLRRAAGLGASPIVNLHVVYDRRVTDLPLAAGVRSPVQFVFDRTASAGLERGQYLAVSLSAAEAWIRRPQDELRRIFLPALEELFPAARAARVRRFLVTRSPRATFAAHPGTRRLRPRTTTALPGLFLAGAWTDTGWPATMEGAVQSGRTAAAAALAHAGEASPEERRPEPVGCGGAW